MNQELVSDNHKLRAMGERARGHLKSNKGESNLWKMTLSRRRWIIMSRLFRTEPWGTPKSIWKGWIKSNLNELSVVQCRRCQMEDSLLRRVRGCDGVKGHAQVTEEEHGK